MLYKNVGSKLNINKDDFYNEIKKSKEQDKLTDAAVNYIIKMATHGVRHGNLHYPDYRDEEDCIQAAICDALKRWRRFDETKFSDPFAFFSSVIFNGYANEFKMIHRHRFVKSSEASRIVMNCEFDINRIKKEISNAYESITSSVREMDIKRVRIRIKNDKSSKWQVISMSNLDDIEKFKDDFPFIKTLEIKIDFNSSVNFVALDQSSDDSEIFNI